MIKSMTAFSREVYRGETGELTWEVRSVNHRFLEPAIRLPEDLRRLEPAVRERLSARLQRGKVDCQLRYVASPGALGSLQVNHHLLAQVVAAANEVGEVVGAPATPLAYDLLRWPGVLQEEGQDLDVVMTQAMALLEATIDGLVAAREREGARLGEALRERCDRLEVQVAEVRRRLPEILAQARQRLLDRLAEVRTELDPSRLEQEMALLAQRLDVAEEMDRLVAHVAEIRDQLTRRGPLGRRLDFLMQELNREANTLGSKSADVETTRAAVEMKVLIEQMREQVQNLE
ncbi:TIGR00255 family protein [Thioflavicoccus mobilis 8321]|uniref:TIGR00255 family protein n=1 Tax=Thioflavicoccus mobilis 8321 TaxID=765912 RepID=L0GS70_9GAMM|nr:YicC/YloC family endoribonuclease [Thioflavicoccus mobilis]AGA89593.1 TIGR00255 family protein [Thioflavicoccus mobilis 8321]